MMDPADGIPRFHYGSHYSSLGTVLFFLLRLEPFTRAALALQEGHFDHAERLFHSLAESWRNCCNNSADVKELVPEFFCLPAFLKNSSRLPLGERQDGTALGNVVLPPWADGSPDKFVRLHRAALESEFVSQHLHLWIDLIFGCKQRGKAAEEAHNVFYFLTYEGAVDLGAVDDPVQLKAIEAQISLFGQCPSQLFVLPHPPRSPGVSMRGAAPCPPPAPAPMPVGRFPCQRLLAPEAPVVAAFFDALDPGLLTLIDVDGFLRPCRWGMKDKDTVMRIEDQRPKQQRTLMPGLCTAVREAVLSARSGGGVAKVPCRSALLPGAGGCVLSAGHWGGLIWVVSPEEGLPLQAIHHPRGNALAVAVDDGGLVAVSAGTDCTVAVWRVGAQSDQKQQQQQGAAAGAAEEGAAAAALPAPGSASVGGAAGRGVEPQRGWMADANRAKKPGGRRDRAQWTVDAEQGPMLRLCGLTAPATAVAVSVQHNVVLAGSADGTLLLFSLKDGRCIRSIPVPPSHEEDLPDTPPADAEHLTIVYAAIAEGGELAVHALGTSRHYLCVYSLNGSMLACMQLRSPLNTMQLSSCGRWLVAGARDPPPANWSSFPGAFNSHHPASSSPHP